MDNNNGPRPLRVALIVAVVLAVLGLATELVSFQGSRGRAIGGPAEGCGGGDPSVAEADSESDAADSSNSGSGSAPTGNVSNSANDDCGDETIGGRCEDGVLIRCQSAAQGEILRIECPRETECVGGEDGEIAECVPVGGDGCGAITGMGECDGAEALWCDQGEMMIVRDVCDEGEVCGLDDDSNYRCVASNTAADDSPEESGEDSSGGYNVSGTFVYKKKLPTENGLGGTVTAPIRFADVQVRRAADNTILARGTTSSTGSFSIGYAEDSEAYVVVLTSASNSAHALSVRDCPEARDAPDRARCPDGEGYGNVHALRSGDFQSAETRELGQLAATPNGAAGAFNIFDIGIRVYDFARANLGQRPPPLVVQWRRNTRPGPCPQVSCAGQSIMWILSTQQDSDEFDDSVLGHEYGHFIENHFSRSHSPGGFHDGSPTDPRLAWGEGYGTFFGALIAGTPIYIDTYGTGSLVMDISDVGGGLPSRFWRANPTSSLGISQPVGEFLVSEILWQIAKGTDDFPAFQADEIFDVMQHYLRKFPGRFELSQIGYPLDRGVAGVELVDFLDGWFCRGHGSQPIIKGIVNDTHRFPYDYPNLSSCL